MIQKSLSPQLLEASALQQLARRRVLGTLPMVGLGTPQLSLLILDFKTSNAILEAPILEVLDYLRAGDPRQARRWRGRPGGGGDLLRDPKDHGP